MLATDDKNSVLSEVSKNGRKARAYSAYGYSGDDASAQSGLGYNGELQDSATGHYLLGKGYRIYSPAMMRFYSPDSWSPFGEGGVNGYAYVGGDPVKYKDPTGHMPSPTLALLMAVAEKLKPFASKSSEIINSPTLSNGRRVGVGASDNIMSAGDSVLAKTANTKTPDIPAPDYPWGSPPKSPVRGGQKSNAASSYNIFADSLDASMQAHGARIIEQDILNYGRPPDIKRIDWVKMSPEQRMEIFNEQNPAPSTNSFKRAQHIRSSNESGRGIGKLFGKKHPGNKFD